VNNEVGPLEQEPSPGRVGGPFYSQIANTFKNLVTVSLWASIAAYDCLVIPLASSRPLACTTRLLGEPTHDRRATSSST
jgi:hypothetical protein